MAAKVLSIGHSSGTDVEDRFSQPFVFLAKAGRDIFDVEFGTDDFEAVIKVMVRFDGVEKFQSV